MTINITCVTTNITDMTSTAAPEGRPLGTSSQRWCPVPAPCMDAGGCSEQTVLSNQEPLRELTVPCRDAPEPNAECVFKTVLHESKCMLNIEHPHLLMWVHVSVSLTRRQASVRPAERQRSDFKLSLFSVGS